MHKVIYDYRVLKDDFREIGAKDKKNIIKIVEKKLFRDPEKFGQKLRAPFSHFYKLRVGNYRIIFTIRENTVIVIKIGHRRSVYENLLKRV